MEINNIVNFILYSVFTFGVILVLIPLGLNFTYGSIKHIHKHGISKFQNYAVQKIYGKYPLEMLLIGIFGLSFSIWYLFIDQGGNLYMYYTEASKYLKSY